MIVLVLFASIATIFAGKGNYNQAELMKAQGPKSAPVATNRRGYWRYKSISTLTYVVHCYTINPKLNIVAFKLDKV